MPTITERDSGDPDLPLIEVTTDELVLVFAPGVGGRLISIVADGVERLWRDTSILDDRLRVRKPRESWPPIDGSFASWTNLGGSKTWPAPQGWGGAGQWAGPPDAVLDAGQWTVAIGSDDDGRALIELTSAGDPVTGLQVQRRFAIPRDGRDFNETVRFTNISTETIRWSAWEVVQVPVAPGDVVEVESVTAEVVDLGAYHGTASWQHNGSVVRIPVAPVVAKLGFPGADGTIRVPGVLELTTRAIGGTAVYPDHGSRAEVWMQSPLDHPIEVLSGLQPTAWLIELELLSPLHDLTPGHSFEFSLGWVVPRR